MIRNGCLLLGCLLLFSCKDEVIDNPPVYDPSPYSLEWGDFPAPDLPADNALTVEKVKLGKMLFHDKTLSRDLSQSCADCHIQGDGFSDIRQFSIGVDQMPGRRNAMALFNLAWHKNGFFWDGRSPTLRHQALQPIQDPLEMHETLPNVVAKLSAIEAYRDQFIRAFGDEEVTTDRIALAIEQFEITMVSNNSKYDRFLRGEEVLTEAEERGRQLYFAEFDPRGIEKGAECFHCHGGFNFTNDLLMNNGLDEESNFTDLGLFEVTNNSGDRAKFKVPSLRNIAVTPPYMHDGRFATLREVLEHYDHGVKYSSTVDILMQYNLDPGLGLSNEDLDDLEAFLHTLTDDAFLENEVFASPF
ncbi:MAG: cytochrome-c peroxidase [Saprospiraceae bacterium]|nr:cytochrome-c peroxidase [Saprospiraceae bacterium]